MILLSHSKYLHMPRTGGTWLNHQLPKLCGVEILHNPKSHATLLNAGYPEKRPWCTVRNPADWLRSVWRANVEKDWRHSYSHCWFRADSFPEYVDAILKSFEPDWISRYWFVYCGLPDVLVLPLERIREMLIPFLRHLGETVDTNKEVDVPPCNCSKVQTEANYAEGQREAILKANPWAVDRWQSAMNWVI